MSQEDPRQILLHSLPNDQQQPGKPWEASSSLICGIIACSLNILLFTSPLGILMGFVAILFGLIGVVRHRNGLPGLILGLLSFVILAIWIFTFLVILKTDPTITFSF